jgi:hypothetical protein
MKALAISLVLLSTTVLAHERGHLPANYQSLDACQKQELLWKDIKRSEHKELPKLSKFGLFQLIGMSVQALKYKIERNADVAPKKWKKYLHRRGSVAKVKFVPTENSPYTGVFQGAECALLRMSITYRPTKKRGFAPGLALKFLRDGKPSANISALYKLEGQDQNHNILANPLSNIVPMGSGLGMKLVHKVFSKVTDYPEELLLNHFADRDETGKDISNPKAPRQVFFVPNDSFNFSTGEHDFRKDLKTIPEGTALYKVYAVSDEKVNFDYTNYTNADIAKFLKSSSLIGEIITDSEFVASEFGDNGIFFRHEVRPKTK